MTEWRFYRTSNKVFTDPGNIKQWQTSVDIPTGENILSSQSNNRFSLLNKA